MERGYCYCINLTKSLFMKKEMGNRNLFVALQNKTFRLIHFLEMWALTLFSKVTIIKQAIALSFSLRCFEVLFYSNLYFNILDVNLFFFIISSKIALFVKGKLPFVHISVLKVHNDLVFSHICRENLKVPHNFFSDFHFAT